MIVSLSDTGDLKVFCGMPSSQTTHNAVAVLGASGDLAVRCDQSASTSVHFILDVNGYFQ